VVVLAYVWLGGEKIPLTTDLGHQTKLILKITSTALCKIARRI
jgi:hypothetical protein